MLFLLLSSLTAHAALPTVSPDTFHVGDAWSWKYTAPDGKFYSQERYTVVGKAGSIVQIEMATRYEAEAEFKPHHRIEADVNRCLAAYSNAVEKKPWSFAMYYFENGRWNRVQNDKTLAFEEKFNCDSFERDNRDWRTVFGVFESGAYAGRAFFEQKLWRRMPGSHFFLDGEDAGVMATKQMDHGPGSPVYQVEFSGKGI